MNSNVKKDRKAEKLMAKQKQEEELRLEEEKTKLEHSKLVRSRGSKALLKTSPVGVTSNLSKTTGGSY